MRIRASLGIRRALRPFVSRCGGHFLSASLSTLALVSFTAAAGESTRILDEGFRRSTSIEINRLTLMPPRLSALHLVTGERTSSPPERPSGSVSAIMPHLRPVDLSRARQSAGAPGAPLLFLTDPALFPERALEPPLTMARASSLLIAHMNRFGGQKREPIFRAGTTGDATPQGTSPKQLSAARPDGATPAVGTAVRLASVTPMPLGPEIVAASRGKVPAFALLGGQKGTTSPYGNGYLDLIDPENRKREQKCLAEAIYFESRSEPEAGQAAVAQVVLNRVKSGLYPTSVCGVVYQNRHRYKACQFTFACEGKSLAITEPEPWLQAQRIARAVMEGSTYDRKIGASTHYHADYVAPYWSRRLKRNDRIGRHIFYSLKPGQT